jgi:hypothetical protein
MGTTIKMNGREMQVSNSFSSGPGTATREYELRSEWAPGQFTYTRVRRTHLGWFIEDGSTWQPSLSCFGRFVTVEA